MNIYSFPEVNFTLFRILKPMVIRLFIEVMHDCSIKRNDFSLRKHTYLYAQTYTCPASEKVLGTKIM